MERDETPTVDWNAGRDDGRMTRRWIAGLGVSLLVSGLVETPSALAAVDVVTNHASVSAVGFDGGGDIPDPVVKEATDVSAFSESVTDSDASTGRRGDASASQNTTVDSSDPLVTSVSSVGAVGASFTDGAAGEGAAPSGGGTSEFTITFEITDGDTPFSLVGSIEATADATNANCTTVTVTSPSGTRFDVAAPAGCGSLGQSIDDSGMLAVGTHIFSVVANASAANPNAAGGSAAASFNLSLTLGCTLTGTDGDDVLVGNDAVDDALDDVICGLGGDDQIDGLGGSDFLLGGPGDDTLRGGPGLDRILGEGDDDIISGGEDEDFLFGGDGNDVINGDEAQDVIEGGLGNDILAGGDGVDIIDGDNGSVGVVFGIENDCEVATSGPGLNDDEIFGGSEQDFIRGCQGLDKIRGEGGDDEIDGNTGNDVLLGGPGRDKLRGQQGRDTLDGGPRRDVLLGGPGNDLLRARDGARDVVKGGGGGNDQAKVDSDEETVTGVEVLLP